MSPEIRAALHAYVEVTRARHRADNLYIRAVIDGRADDLDALRRLANERGYQFREAQRAFVRTVESADPEMPAATHGDTPLHNVGRTIRHAADTLERWKYDDTTAQECAALGRLARILTEVALEVDNLATLAAFEDGHGVSAETQGSETPNPRNVPGKER